MALLCLVAKLDVVVAHLTLGGGGRVAAVVAAALAAVAALIAAVTSSSSGSGSTAVVYVDMLSLTLFKTDSVYVCLGVVL